MTNVPNVTGMFKVCTWIYRQTDKEQLLDNCNFVRTCYGGGDWGQGSCDPCNFHYMDEECQAQSWNRSLTYMETAIIGLSLMCKDWLASRFRIMPNTSVLITNSYLFGFFFNAKTLIIQITFYHACLLLFFLFWSDF